MSRWRFATATMCLVAASALIALLSPSLPAQQPELPKVWERIDELERRIKRLEALLKGHEETIKEKIGHEYGWQNKRNWRSLKIGMTEGQVKSFLGEPTKVISGVRTLWYYPNIYCGYVSFDRNGYLTGWNEP